MTNLLGLTCVEIADLLALEGEPSYRGRQVANWVHHRDAVSFSQMSNVPKQLRSTLENEYSLSEPKVLEVCESRDGSKKYLFQLDDGATVEGVVMPEGSKATVCLSCQTGCAVGCTFCVTGALGSGRNLTPAEIVGQFRSMRRGLDVERLNLVFMGMGEPLLTTRNLGRALSVLYERVSPKRITVSTAGIVPGIKWLGSLARPPKLAVSLNAPDQERRELIMPISRKYPLDQVMEAIRAFPLKRGRRVTFEYVLIRDFNDTVGDARAVARLLTGIPAKVNVIPLNEDPEHFPALYQPCTETVDAFGRALRDLGLVVTVRWSKGADVAAACGQLKGRWSVSG
jgi:23S rRNA (adenine2503-C2)-methyltransferase